MKNPSGNQWLQFFRLLERIRNRIFSSLVRGSFREFGSGSTLQMPIGIWGASAISIGEKVYLGAGSWLHFLGQEDPGAKHGIEIGDGCNFAGAATISAVRLIQIGDHVLFGRNIHISDHGHKFSDLNQPIISQGITEARPVFIGSGSWIGQGVIICPGVTIGKNCVIGANSVVKSDVPDHCVAVGAPARVVRKIGAQL